jgi:hypothetical protein
VAALSGRVYLAHNLTDVVGDDWGEKRRKRYQEGGAYRRIDETLNRGIRYTR